MDAPSVASKTDAAFSATPRLSRGATLDESLKPDLVSEKIEACQYVTAFHLFIKTYDACVRQNCETNEPRFGLRFL